MANLTIDDAIDSHPGEAAWKGFAIGGSMFLLAPVIDFHYDYGTHLTLELERWDGTVKTYHAESSGTARYNLFSASPSMIAELKGHVVEEEPDPTLQLPVSAFIPEDFVADPHQRLSLYKRLTACGKVGELALLHGEIQDRYGHPPEPVERLLEVMQLRMHAKRLRLASIDVAPTQRSVGPDSLRVDRLRAALIGKAR